MSRLNDPVRSREHKQPVLFSRSSSLLYTDMDKFNQKPLWHGYSRDFCRFVASGYFKHPRFGLQWTHVYLLELQVSTKIRTRWSGHVIGSHDSHVIQNFWSIHCLKMPNPSMLANSSLKRLKGSPEVMKSSPEVASQKNHYPVFPETMKPTGKILLSTIHRYSRNGWWNEGIMVCKD